MCLKRQDSFIFFIISSPLKISSPQIKYTLEAVLVSHFFLLSFSALSKSDFFLLKDETTFSHGSLQPFLYCLMPLEDKLNA